MAASGNFSDDSKHQEGNPAEIIYGMVNGQIEIKIKPRGLSIAWGKDNRYWRVPQEGDMPAELLKVCWFEVNGSVDTDPRKDYEVIFNLSLTSNAYGWTEPVYIIVKRGKGGSIVSKQFQVPKTRTNFELRCKVMKLEKEKPESRDRKLYFCLYEVADPLDWKGGLWIHHVIVKEA